MQRKNIYDMNGVLIGFIITDNDKIKVYQLSTDNIQHYSLPPKTFELTSQKFARPNELSYIRGAKPTKGKAFDLPLPENPMDHFGGMPKAIAKEVLHTKSHAQDIDHSGYTCSPLTDLKTWQEQVNRAAENIKSVSLRTCTARGGPILPSIKIPPPIFNDSRIVNMDLAKIEARMTGVFMGKYEAGRDIEQYEAVSSTDVQKLKLKNSAINKAFDKIKDNAINKAFDKICLNIELAKRVLELAKEINGLKGVSKKTQTKIQLLPTVDSEPMQAPILHPMLSVGEEPLLLMGEAKALPQPKKKCRSPMDIARGRKGKYYG